MDDAAIEAILDDCERDLDTGARPDLRALGFWRAVGATKRRRDRVARYAERIALIDRRVFLARVRLAFPLPVGVALHTLATAAGVALLLAALTGFAVGQDPTLVGIAVLLGAGALIGATHDLAHLIVGALAGIRFTHWYMDVPTRPQPGVKIEYASYLESSPRGRAWMHASGAIVTKLIPFAAVPVALAARAPWWAPAILIAIGVVQLVTDLLFSVRSGDWKKFRREMSVAKTVRG